MLHSYKNQLIDVNQCDCFLHKWSIDLEWLKVGLSPTRPLFIFKEALNEVKAKGLQLIFKHISIVLNMVYNKNKLYKALDY